MIEVIDCSVLYGSDAWARDNRPDLAHHVDAAIWQAHQNRAAAAGIRLTGAAIMPFPAADRSASDAGPAFDAENDIVITAAAGGRQDGDGLRAVCAVVPGDTASVEALARRLEDGAPVMGVKLWPYLGRFDLDALVSDTALLRLVRDHRLAVFMHPGNGREAHHRPGFAGIRATPDVAISVAEALPDITCVIGHVARLCPDTLMRAGRLASVFIDLSGLTSLGRWQEGGVDGLPVAGGAVFAGMTPGQILARLTDGMPGDDVPGMGLGGRLLFGTTWPFCTWWGIDLADDVAMVANAPVSATTRSMILRDNARALFARCGARAGTVPA